MQKISSNDAAVLLKQAGTAIRDLTRENLELQQQNEKNAYDSRVVKLAREMEDKDLMPEFTLAEKVAHLRKVPNIEVTAEAVKIAAPQGQGFGGVSEVPGSGEHPFVTFINTGESPDGL